MFDEEEIAYCPICGAPHHRDCFRSAGHCGYEAQHGTPAQYQPPKAPAEDPAPQAEHSAQKACSGCGKTIAGTETFCPHCGRPLAGPQHSFGQMFSGADPLAGINKEEPIEPGSDITAEETAQYIGPNAQRYLPRFKQLGAKKKTSWNWAAFLFPQGWFFFRKVYLPGTLFFILSVATTLMMYNVYSLFARVPEEMQTGTTVMLNYLTEHLTAADLPVLALAFAGSAANLILRIFAALFGDWFYRSSALERIAKAKESEDYDEQPQLVLRKWGWVNPILFMLGFFGVTWVSYFVYTLL